MDISIESGPKTDRPEGAPERRVEEKLAGHMGPCLAAPNGANLRLRYAELARNSELRSACDANGLNLFYREFCRAVALAAPIAAPFAGAIPRVVAGSPEK